MTEPIKVQPGDPNYQIIYNFWITNSKPLINRILGGVYMMLNTDGMTVFVQLSTQTDMENFQSVSTGV